MFGSLHILTLQRVGSGRQGFGNNRLDGGISKAGSKALRWILVQSKRCYSQGRRFVSGTFLSLTETPEKSSGRNRSNRSENAHLNLQYADLEGGFRSARGSRGSFNPLTTTFAHRSGTATEFRSPRSPDNRMNEAATSNCTSTYP